MHEQLNQTFADLPNLIPDLVPQLIEREDPTLANLFIDLNAQVREVYEATTELMDPAQYTDLPNMDELFSHLEQQKKLLKNDLELRIMLIERHPDLALWMMKTMAMEQMENL